ncbi:MAG: PQQ-binding-like beta-propeller repeat protein [Alphaproteobacteria bacterium]|nr:PQQ-binding-like beta-propeller repeat protein [Alphaproteobacteria bacterium]
MPARNPFHTAVVLVTFAMLPLSAAAKAGSMDWPQTYIDHGHTSFNDREKTLSPANVANLKLNWARSFSGDVRAFVINDHYAIARTPSDNGKNLDLWYLNYKTGETVWRIDTGPDVGAMSRMLAVGRHRIFSACGLTDDIGYNYSGLCAYHKKNGQISWQFSNPCHCSPEAGVVAAPAFALSGLIFFGYFNGGAGGKEYAIAVNADTGAFYGAYPTGGRGSFASAGIVFGKDQVYFGCDTSICTLARADGSLRWKQAIGAPAAAMSVGKNGALYVSLCNGASAMIALDKNGTPLWTYGSPQCGTAPAAVAGNHLYFTAADGNVHVLDAGTGYELLSAAPGTASSPSLANGVMYVAGNDQTPGASAYDAQSGTLLWSNAPRAGAYHLPPEIIDGTLFVANQECGSVCAYGLAASRRSPLP